MDDGRSAWDVWLSRAATALFVVALLLVLGLTVGPLFLPYKIFTVLSPSMSPTIPVGAEVVDRVVAPETIRKGDVITFPEPDRPSLNVTHRVVGLERPAGRLVAITKGDANGAIDTWRVPLRGPALKALFWVPYAGYLLNGLQQPATRLVFVGLISLLALLFVRELWQEHE